MEENILDWIIWKIMKLGVHAEHHSHITAMTPIGMNCGHILFKEERESEWYKERELRAQYKILQSDIKQFDDLKKEIMESPCPIVKLREELTQVEKQVKELDVNKEYERQQVREVIDQLKKEFENKKKRPQTDED